MNEQKIIEQKEEFQKEFLEIQKQTASSVLDAYKSKCYIELFPFAYDHEIALLVATGSIESAIYLSDGSHEDYLHHLENELYRSFKLLEHHHAVLGILSENMNVNKAMDATVFAILNRKSVDDSFFNELEVPVYCRSSLVFMSLLYAECERNEADKLQVRLNDAFNRLVIG